MGVEKGRDNPSMRHIPVGDFSCLGMKNSMRNILYNHRFGEGCRCNPPHTPSDTPSDTPSTITPLEETSKYRLTEQELSLFSNITNFIEDLSGCYDNLKSLRLYNRLLEKTNFRHLTSIRKHNSLFTAFYMKNKSAIMNKDVNSIVGDITFNSKIYLGVSRLITNAPSADIRNAIWNHLLKISSIIDPTNNAESILRNLTRGEGKEEKFINGMVDSIQGLGLEENNSNPMEAITTMMSSGIFNDMVTSMNSGIQSGDLDLSKMMGMMSGLMTHMGNP
jgi:hypothetical protein